MLIVVIAKDRPVTGLERRMLARPAHLAYLETLGDKVRMGGAMFSEDGGEPRGSVLFLEVASLEEAQAILTNDPYVKADVFETVEMRPFRQAVGVTVGLG